MQLTATLCRAQEAIQRERAASAVLDNVRTVAEKAAHVWWLEAKAADIREARKQRALALAERKAARTCTLASDRMFSENPDRGMVAGAAGQGASAPAPCSFPVDHH